MQSVGIMSMQRIFNYGSTLQAHSLKRLIEEIAPESLVEFVDFTPGPPLLGAGSRSQQQNGLTRAVQKVREYGAVTASLRNKLRFFNHKRTYASRNFPLVGITEEMNFNLNLDVQIIGSDEVFNCVQQNANVGYSPDLFGRDSPARRLVTYAGSFGNTTIAKIAAAGIAQQLVDDFIRFSEISVRDSNSANIVETLTGRRPEIHLDPTLVYPLMEAEYRIPADRQHKDKYVIVYGYSGRFTVEENAAVRDYARSIGAQVLAFGGLQASADEFVDSDPFTMLAYFRDAEAVITDTFHGTIFSILNEVPFVTLIRSSSTFGYGNEEKISDLLDSLRLDGRILKEPQELGELLGTAIDYSQTREILALERSRSIEYLARALGGPHAVN